MDSFLYWYSQNNKIIIQVLCVCIALVLIYFVYRLFFSATEGAPEGVGSDPRTQATHKQILEIDKKLNSLLEHQTQVSTRTVEVTEESAATEAIPEGASERQNEVEQLKKELQASLEQIQAKNAELNTVKEKLIEHQKTLPNVSPDAASTSEVEQALTGDAALMAKIDELQKKLQEYDIISDDIAELQSLRAENAELKSKIATAG